MAKDCYFDKMGVIVDFYSTAYRHMKPPAVFLPAVPLQAWRIEVSEIPTSEAASFIV